MESSGSFSIDFSESWVSFVEVTAQIPIFDIIYNNISPFDKQGIERERGLPKVTEEVYSRAGN